MKWYSAYCFEVTVHQILIELLHFLKNFQSTFFPDNSFYSFHPVRLKHGGQLDFEVFKGILFRAYSTLNFDRGIVL